MSPINLTAEAYTIPFQGHELHARVFRPAAPAIGRIFYLHGGGLVFGEPDDLPLCYVNLFSNAGYELISLDYPLAPEQRLAVILDAVHAASPCWIQKSSQICIHLVVCRFEILYQT